MQWVFDDDGRLKDKVVLAVLVGALAVGLLLYNVVPTGSGEARAATPVSAFTNDVDGAGVASGVTASAPPLLPSSGGSFTTGITTTAAGALVQRALGGDGVEGLDAGAGTSSAPSAPSTPAAPAPECPTAAASDAYESVADPIAEAIGERVPRDNLRLLTEIAAGCRDDTPTTPLLGLALDLARLVPDTGLAPLDLSAIPPVAVPDLPQPVIDALAPLNEQIMEACGNVGLLGVIVAVVPSTAGIPVNGSELADLLVPAQSLCAQFEASQAPA
jgi:hypothetical protein